MTEKPSIAIVGMGAVFPNAATPETFWKNIANGVDASREVPQGRWSLGADETFDSRVGRVDHVYSKRGCFVEENAFRLDADALPMSSGLLSQLDPLFHLLLYAGQEAFRDAQAERWDRGRIGVAIGNLFLPTEASSALAMEVLGRTFEEKVLGQGSSGPKTHSFNRRVAGLPAALLAQSLALGGGSRCFDAACASSLYALKFAVDELVAGRVDAMLAGGVSRPDALYTQMGFSQLRALSPTGQCSPFDEKGDGLVVGEGAGLFVLRRLEDAVRDSDTIYGVIRGIGLSNDVGGRLLAPTSEGQLRAMAKAYAEAGWDPRAVDLIECHATGTPVGDAVEVASLKELWEGDGHRMGQCVIGSVKSNVGHLLTAAGSAALMKVLLALKHKTLPPTANFSRPAQAMGLEDSPFRVLSESVDWTPQSEGETRKAAVSAFGFGGINAHVLIEEWREDDTATVAFPKPNDEREGGCPIAIVGMDAHFGPWSSLRQFQERVFNTHEDDDALTEGRSWGVTNSAWMNSEGLDPGAFKGYLINELQIPLNRYRIPPRELEEMLPQQLLMLEVAANAWTDAGFHDKQDLEAGVFIGLGLDPNTTNFHVRWSIQNKAKGWARQLDRSLSVSELEMWVEELRNAFGPPLTANRTMGALGSIVASRIARELRLGGPSFAVSSEERSGISALESAVRSLQIGTIESALVGAVDFPGDVRSILSAGRERPFSTTGKIQPFDTNADGTLVGEGAAAIVLKRLEDAERDGDRVYAVIRGIGSAGGAAAVNGEDGHKTYRQALDRAYEDSGVHPDTIGYIDAHGSGVPEEDALETRVLAQYFRYVDPDDDHRCALGSVKADIGHTGAASGLASVVKAALCLYQEIIPPLRNISEEHDAFAHPECKLFVPRQPQFWLRNRGAGKRRAAVSTMSVDGGCAHVVLEALEPTASPGLEVAKRQPLGAHREGLFVVEGNHAHELLDGVGRLRAFIELERDRQPTMEALARRWWQERGYTGRPALAATMVARAVSELLDQITFVQHSLEDDPLRPIGKNGTPLLEPFAKDRIFYNPEPVGRDGEVAFVFPGSGNHFAEMGRELFAHWPEILRRHDLENEFLRSQFQPDRFWGADPSGHTHHIHKALIFGQVALGTAASDILVKAGVIPKAVIGYSLGETAGLFALRAWKERDEMLRRINASNLFTTELAGDYDAARKRWQLPKHEAVDWVLGVIDRPMKVAKAALKNRKKVYPLIANTLHETVIGGNRRAVEHLITQLECQFIPLEGVTSVHCEIVMEVEKEYRDLHLLETRRPPDLRFYSGAWGKSYILAQESAADSIVAQAIEGVDFPKMIESAYGDGVRIFVELGPGTSCSRMIGKILGDQPHMARSVCYQGQDAVSLILRALAHLIAERTPVNMETLYAYESRAVGLLEEEDTRAPSALRLPVRGVPFRVPLPAKHKSPEVEPVPALAYQPPQTASGEETPVFDVAIPLGNALADQTRLATQATADAHGAFLDLSASLAETLSETLAFQMKIIEEMQRQHHVVLREQPAPAAPSGNGGASLTPKVVFTRDECLEFATGSIAAMLGPDFAPIDNHPTRVRLPDEPLMLVDRITALEGEPKSLASGRVVTEHDIHPGAWYLDCGRIPTCIAVEAGQADLFLSGYLGIDFETQGLAVYRLLDAQITFHGPLPGPHEIIQYDIRIERFFRHGNTYLFRFEFDGAVNGQPLITMREGCAGFFTQQELQAGQGIVQSDLAPTGSQGALPKDWQPLLDMNTESYTDDQIDALRIGDLATCFGEQFRNLPLANPQRIPDGRMRLVDRVLHLDPQGGPYSLGLIRAEADIHPDDWFLTCHFTDDPVMPGTLMFECCLHTFRIFLMRMGWVGDADHTAWEPVPGVTSHLKCRGQVLESTRNVTYEVYVKELGYRPEPYAIADALMFSDGKPIVHITDMSIQLTGQTRENLQALWQPKPAAAPSATKPLYDYDSILAFAIGNPSDAFGEAYKIFDKDRVIARLPGPPYMLMSRVTDVQAQAWKVQAGGTIETQYDVPPDAWYFDANRQQDMPFAILLEIGLQPCGWFAAYMGSALNSDTDLKFRNLGGSATQYLPVRSDTGALTVAVKSTNVSTSGGMIIQHYHMTIASRQGKVYEGTTYFGYFSKEALAQQLGVRDVTPYAPTPDEQQRAIAFPYPKQSPFPDHTLRMLDTITLFVPDGGPHKLGFIEGTKKVDPTEWFFKAHFHQDPVMPGSLGLEAFQQLLKVIANHRWNLDANSQFEAIAYGVPHEWIYRGQVIQPNKEVTVQAVITQIDDTNHLIQAHGFLIVDGLIIYQMKNFTLRVV